MNNNVETAADIAIRNCLSKRLSFALIAGAGSGKTRSLVDALAYIRDQDGRTLRQNGQRVACITYTNRAVEVIKSRLGSDSLFIVSTLHSFLWDLIGQFQSDIRETLRTSRLPALIAEERERDTGGTSQKAIKARAKAERLEGELAAIESAQHYKYGDATSSDYPNGQLSHDDIIAIASHLFSTNATFRRITSLRFPYILVDEAQDMFEGIVDGFNLVAAQSTASVIGYFGDPWQRIFKESVGTFEPPPGGESISKVENFRCSESVIKLLNAYRDDVEQIAAGKNIGRRGSVVFRLVKTEKPGAQRGRYSEEQVGRALIAMDNALSDWGWKDRSDVIKLFLVRQMIARRMGFTGLNRLFTGTYASSRAQELFTKGEHSLLLPLTSTIYPLIAADEAGDRKKVIDILRRNAPAFAHDGPNALRTLNTMIELSIKLVRQIGQVWESGTIRDVLQFCAENKVIRHSEKLMEHLNRAPRTEKYDDETYSIDKGDWLADGLFEMKTEEIPNYASYVSNNAAFSTQHGVKGEEYAKVFVVYDDTEAAWGNYSFSKILTPKSAGEPTDGQLKRGRNLAYVSFSRATEDLRVLLFTPNPQQAKEELIEKKLLESDQIELS